MSSNCKDSCATAAPRKYVTRAFAGNGSVTPAEVHSPGKPKKTKICWKCCTFWLVVLGIVVLVCVMRKDK